VKVEKYDVVCQAKIVPQLEINVPRFWPEFWCFWCCKNRATLENNVPRFCQTRNLKKCHFLHS